MSEFIVVMAIALAAVALIVMPDAHDQSYFSGAADYKLCHEYKYSPSCARLPEELR